MSSEKRVSYPVLETQAMSLNLGGVAERSGEKKSQTKESLHKKQLTERNRSGERLGPSEGSKNTPRLTSDAKRHTLG